MEYKHIRDIDFSSCVGSRVFGIFLARDVDLRTQKDGVTKYLHLTMCDRDFSFEANKFGASESEINCMKSGYVYRAAIDVKEYVKSPTGYSCNLYNFEVHNEPASMFIEWTEGMEKAQGIIQSALNKISNSVYGKLVYNLLTSNWDKFSIWTAGSSLHHNALGGLLVHTAEVVEQSENIGNMWEDIYGHNFINKPLLLSSALLHDLGKIHELTVDRYSGNTGYSTEASLETHISICLRLLEVEACKLGIGIKSEDKSDEQLNNELEALSLLRHCILSHHGKKEYGSPISPNTPEALILHMSDYISAEMYRYNKVFKNIDCCTSNTTWVGGNMICAYKDSTKQNKE